MKGARILQTSMATILIEKSLRRKRNEFKLSENENYPQIAPRVTARVNRGILLLPE
jgi:hypothetical protein